MHGRAIRILTNTAWFDEREIDGVPVRTRRTSTWRRARVGAALGDLLAARHCDAVVLNGVPRVLLVFCVLKLLMPLWRFDLVAVDLVLPRPSSLPQRLRAAGIRALYRAVDRFIVYCKDTSGMQRFYGVRGDRADYVPFKVNGYERVMRTPTRDDGYILSCGRTYRDYNSFCGALAGLRYSGRILTRPDELQAHGSRLDPDRVPPNVTLVRHDGSQESWLDCIARARMVVLPILPAVLNPAGISVYLMAMALGKCVIITEGPGTRGILDGGRAIVVPPRDPVALRRAIVRASEDVGYRERIARAGRDYARSLGGERRLAEDVARIVLAGSGDRSGRVPRSARTVPAGT